MGGNREKGASAVEFALILPVLVVILFGIIEFGFILFDKAVITNASREGARTGIVFREPSGTVNKAFVENLITTTVNNYASSFVVSFEPVKPPLSTTIQGDCLISGSTLTVTVDYPYTFLLVPRLVTALPETVGLSGVTVMQCENI